MKSEYKKAKGKLDRIHAQYIRTRDKNLPCISCGKFAKLENGHYYSRNILSLRWDDKNCNGQCHYCNHTLEGNRQGYREGLIKKYGEGVIDSLDKQSRESTKLKIYDVEELIEIYTELIKNLDV